MSTRHPQRAGSVHSHQMAGGDLHPPFVALLLVWIVNHHQHSDHKHRPGGGVRGERHWACVNSQRPLRIMTIGSLEGSLGANLMLAPCITGDQGCAAP